MQTLEGSGWGPETGGGLESSVNTNLRRCGDRLNRNPVSQLGSGCGGQQIDVGVFVKTAAQAPNWKGVQLENTSTWVCCAPTTTEIR